MLFNMVGGGAGVNFAVVGGTSAPTSPKENTLWVNTPTEITGVVFSVNQPTGVNGLVWIRTATISGASFDAIGGKNRGVDTVLEVYPVECRQYVSGSWQSMVMEFYQNGEWKEFSLDLYKDGNECIGVTGGWVGKNIKILSFVTTSTTPTVTKNAASIYGAIWHVHGTSYCGIMGPANAIDLTHYSTIKFTVSAYTGPVSLYVHDGTTKIAEKAVTGIGELSLDISAITGTHSIGFVFNTSNDDSTVTVTRCTLYR